ncbi:hypothetical protein FB45DRAFT_871277 [Roridomyces roridus]|uniref:Uncharacterized protein n=1 Tax=Roridomyces roridus TaxID=1738132 RepID=A0AAD7FHG7_9AGAR|nr:hypothetical protein FB45DRAFT_871277 [Roridomyces roridus]
MNDLHSGSGSRGHDSSRSYIPVPPQSPNGYAGAFFPGSHSLTIQGGVFSSSVTNHIYPSRPECSEIADFRRLPFGDIDLQREIFCDENGIVFRWRRARSQARRVYSAKIFGSDSDMTVMFYEGDDALHVSILLVDVLYLWGPLVSLRIFMRISMTPTSIPGVDPQEGYLFVCPVEDLNIGTASVGWPLHDHSPWFWSLDTTGGNRLSAEDAALVGFPGIELSSQAWLASWDATIYEGLGDFHRAKGFNPDSQDVARELGYSLYHPDPTVFEEMWLCNGHDDDAIKSFLSSSIILDFLKPDDGIHHRPPLSS